MKVKAKYDPKNVFNFPQSIPLFKLYTPPNLSKCKTSILKMDVL